MADKTIECILKTLFVIALRVYASKLLNLSKQKSVKLLVDCLFLNSGSGKPFPLNKHETIHARRRELSLLILKGNLPDFELRRIRAKKLNYYYVFNLCVLLRDYVIFNFFNVIREQKYEKFCKQLI
jgi:hypothetical protein